MTLKEKFMSILRPYMKAKEVTKTNLATLLNTSVSSLSHRLDNPRNFRLWELQKIANYLNLSPEDRIALLSV